MSDSPQTRLEADLKTAMKAREAGRVSTLRLLLNRVKNERIAIGEEVDEDRFLGLVQKAIKQHRESAEAFRSAGREEQAAREEEEAEQLAEYLPAPVSEDRIRTAIEELVAERELSGPPALGPIMKELLARFSGQTDGETIHRVARQVLGL